MIFGGTGVSLSTVLPDNIERCAPDYSLYPNNDTSYGFLTRGCVRKCYFCCVPEKEGTIRQVARIRDIAVHKKIKFLDNNILALRGHIKLLEELAELKIRCQFIQGLDIRLVNPVNSVALSKLRYFGDLIFAFDAWGSRDIIDKKLRLLSWVREWQPKFYVYVAPEMPLSDTVKRVLWLKEHKCIPYIMRDIRCWEDRNRDFYTDVAAYCNQVPIFKKMDFGTYMEKRYPDNARRVTHSQHLWHESLI